jgi:NO-binding membrane sensor protein with MHYT domain
VVTVHNFSYGLVNPALGYAVSCLGAFLGLRCLTRASYHEGLARARWLAIAATSIGAAGIWAMHFIAVVGIGVTTGASLVMGAAVSGMHYTGMAAMRLHAGGMAGMAGMSAGVGAASFVLPLLLGITLVTFVLAVTISMSPSVDEIREDAEFQFRLNSLQRES